MKAVFIFCCCFFSFAAALQAQNNCPEFKDDTLFLPRESKRIVGEYIGADLKNGSNFRLYKTGNRYFLKLIVHENLYFEKVDLLEIQSGDKSFYAKDTKQMELDKSSGYFVVEIYKNYVATLREEGFSAILFGKVETPFTRSDGNQVRQLAKCFYQSIDNKK